MPPIFNTPDGFRRAGWLLMAVNIGNIVTFAQFIRGWLTPALSWTYVFQGLFVIFFHLVTIILLSMAAGKMSAQARMFKRMIQVMEGNGFVYDPVNKEFKPGIKKDF